MGLGFGMFINETLQTTKEGFGLTVFTILLTLGLGIALTKLFKIDLKLGHLITSGTAICGGSAIAAISPIIKANNKIISMALVIVFLLNSIALFLFPVLGHYFQLTQEQFDALTVWVYNLGPTNFRNSTLLKRLNESNFEDVPAQIKRWNKAGGQELAGLTKRRASEAHLFATGEVVH